MTIRLNLWMWSNYYSQTLELLKFQAEKRPILVLTTPPTVAQYLFVIFDYGRISGGETHMLNSTILKPGESAEWTWRFTVSTDIKERVHGSIVFSIMTTDGTIAEFVVERVSSTYVAMMRIDDPVN